MELKEEQKEEQKGEQNEDTLGSKQESEEKVTVDGEELSLNKENQYCGHYQTKELEAEQHFLLRIGFRGQKAKYLLDRSYHSSLQRLDFEFEDVNYSEM